MDHDREARYRSLRRALIGARGQDWTSRPFYFIGMTKPHQRMGYWNGRAANVHCLYCDQVVFVAKQVTKGKRSRHGGRLRNPSELDAIQNKHTYPCAENWWWSVMAKYSTRTMDDVVAEQRVDSWVQRIHQHAAAYDGRYSATSQQWYPTKTDVDIRARMKALPMPVTDPRFTELEVNFFHAVPTVFPKDRPPWKEFVHGADAEHPHIFNPTVFTASDVTDRDLVQHAKERTQEFGRCGCGLYGMRGTTKVKFPCASGEELVAFQRWCIQRKDQFVPWSEWWGKAKGDPRNPEPEEDDDDE